MTNTFNTICWGSSWNAFALQSLNHVLLFYLLSSISAKALGAGAASGGSVVHSVEYAGVGAAMLTAPGAGVV